MSLLREVPLKGHSVLSQQDALGKQERRVWGAGELWVLVLLQCVCVRIKWEHARHSRIPVTPETSRKLTKEEEDCGDVYMDYTMLVWFNCTHVMALQGRPCKRWGGHEGASLMHGTKPLWKEVSSHSPVACPGIFYYVKTQHLFPLRHSPTRHRNCSALTLVFCWETKQCLFRGAQHHLLSPCVHF